MVLNLTPYAVQVRKAPLVLRTDARLCRATAGATVARLADKRACRLGFARLSAPLGAGFKALLCFEKQKWIPEMGIHFCLANNPNFDTILF